ncbi:(2Fe-2S)-binding protein [Sodalis sp. RH21]|uniref:(2Fe-2S)-binding protein n=1 Tax=unclassified Sodalis (in: enterobacteria) TaxID=2636512 RepID=UPI0039B5939D
MADKPLFKAITPQAQALPRRRVNIEFNQRPLSVLADATVAAALLEQGVACFRVTAADGSPRAPWCMMGACFECLVEIDGRSSVQSCMAKVTAGMSIRSDNLPADRERGNE